MRTAAAPVELIEPRPVAGGVGSGRHLTYQPAFDGLRGAAVLAVLLFHAGHLRGGFLGVDLFFTLSGFLITTLLLAEHTGAGRISLAGFWSRRARRLLPALYLVLAATVAYAALFARPDSLEQIRGDTFAALAYVANWHLIATGGDYWSAYAAPSPLEHLWSLAVEEQFYLLWPLVVVGVLALCRRRGADGRRGLLAVAGVLIVLSTVWMGVLAARGGSLTRAYFGTDTRAASILVGAFTALLMVRHGERVRQALARPTMRLLAAAAAGLAAVGLLVAWTRVDGSTSVLLYRGGFLVHALAVAVVIVVVTAAPSIGLARALGAAPLRLLGVISYGLYLWHWPIYLVLTQARTGMSGWALIGLRTGVSVAAAVLSYRLLEAPIRAGAVRGPTLRVATAVALAAIVGGIWITTASPGRVVVTATPSPAPSTTVAAATVAVPAVAAAPPAPPAAPGAPAPATTLAPATTVPPPPSLLKTQPRVSPGALRLRTPTKADPLRVLLFGDSYMFDASPGMAAALDATGVVDATQSGLWGFTITDGSWRKTIAERLDQSQPELVVAMWARFDETWLDKHGRDAYEPRLRDAIAMMVDHGASVAIVGLAPSQTDGLDTSPVARNINAVFRDMVAQFPGRVLYIDPDPIVAPDGVPRLTIQGQSGPMRVRKADLSHFCPDGSARFGEAMTTLLAGTASVPVPDPAAWGFGGWRADARFDNPHGACR